MIMGATALMLLSALTIDYLPGLDCRRSVALLRQKQGRKGGATTNHQKLPGTFATAEPPCSRLNLSCGLTPHPSMDQLALSCHYCK
jgi:hypothetical protein